MRHSATRHRNDLALATAGPSRSPRPVTVRLLPGELRTTSDPGESIVTVLGSCIAACVRNPFTGFGGMNHFMLPESETGNWNGTDSSYRYGNFAMDALIAAVIETGCPRESLDVKIFGGADLYRGSILVGSRNVEFIISYLARSGLTPSAQDIGGTFARKIIFKPAEGRVLRQQIKPHSDEEIIELEQRYRLAMQSGAARSRDIAIRKV